jgi:hypothetical protein
MGQTSSVLTRSFLLANGAFRDESGRYFSDHFYFYVQRQPQPHENSSTIGYLHFSDAIEEAKRLHTSCPRNSRAAFQFYVIYKDTLHDVTYAVAKTEWTVNGAEVVNIVLPTPAPYGDRWWATQPQPQPERISKMHFPLTNPTLPEVPELFWVIYSPPSKEGAVNNAAILPNLGYTEYEEAEKEAGLLHTRLLGQRSVYIMRVDKVAKPVAPLVKFEAPKPTTVAAISSS